MLGICNYYLCIKPVATGFCYGGKYTFTPNLSWGIFFGVGMIEHTIKTKYFLFFIILLWFCSIPLATLMGPMDLSVKDVTHLLAAYLGLIESTGLDPSKLLVVGDIRLARVVLALLCGGALAVAGVALQGVLKNPLADPFTLGISAGAACGASVSLTLHAPLTAFLGNFFSITLMHNLGGVTAVSAFLGAILALFLTLMLSSNSAQGTSIIQNTQRDTVILSGIAVATFLGALVALIKALNEESVTSIVFWIMGSFQGRTWDSLPLLAIPIIIGLLLIILFWRELDLLNIGNIQATQMGLNVARVRFCLLLGASIMTAGCVAVAGIIAFVGLVVPHILRLCLGANHGPLLIAAWFLGGILLVLADVLARTILSGGQELPVGVVTALVGGPFFALLVRHKGRNA